jgi:formamidopyrimidine-DNA glycosylase
VPELPEVEVTMRAISPLLIGQTIERLETTPPSYFFVTPPKALVAAVEGRTVDALVRKGKYIVAQLDDGSQLLLHLGMTGQLFGSGASSLRLLSSTARSALDPNEQPVFRPDKHTHLVFHLSSNNQLFFRDVRKFGKVQHIPSGEQCARLNRLGPDALVASLEQLWPLIKSRKIAIKSALLDQSLLAGVGNIYADEALFHGGVRPTRPANRVKKKELTAIIAALRIVLNRSIETGGSSISDYLQPNGKDGGFQDERKVYGRTGEPCPSCDETILRVVVGARSSHYCPNCQT